MKFPIVVIGDWVSLFTIEAETREEALLKATQNYIESLEDCKVWPDPTGSQD